METNEVAGQWHPAEPAVPPGEPPGEPPIQRVTVVDVDISFAQLVSLFVKGTFALLFVWLFFGVIGAIVFVVFAAMIR